MQLDVDELTQRFYYQRPGWRDGTSQFSAMIRGRLKASSCILDLGAGKGTRAPMSFRRDARMVVGLDPKWSIKDNASVDHGVLGVAQALPFRTAAFDLVFSDWVIEHLSDPAAALKEVFRVLEPGGYFVFRTGNLLHYSYAIAVATPHWFHRIVANRARALVGADNDLDPTYYRMNTPTAVRRCIARTGFIEEEMSMVEAEPSYLMFSVPSFLVGLAYERLVNRSARLSRLRACIFSCARKPI
jgi:SAM-dependent methyltransferase